jgi:hypothetical protein
LVNLRQQKPQGDINHAGLKSEIRMTGTSKCMASCEDSVGALAAQEGELADKQDRVLCSPAFLMQ